MTLVAVAPFSLHQIDQSYQNAQTGTLSGNTLKVATILQAPKTGTIDRVCWRTLTVTTGDTVDVRLETVGTDGHPTGTLLGTNTSGSTSVNAADDNVWFETTLTAGASVTKGDVFAIVHSFAGSGNMQITQITPHSGTALFQFPYCDNHNGTSWSKSQQRWGCGAVRYSDTTYPYTPGLVPVANGTASFGAHAYMSTSSPDEYGNKMTVPFGCKVAGVWLNPSGTNAGNFEVRLYNNAGTLAGSKAFDGDQQSLQAASANWYLFDSEVTVAAGDVIRVSKLATQATNTQLTYWIAPSTALMTAYPLQAVYTSRTDLGSWSDTSDRLANIGLIVSAVSDGSSAPPSDSGDFFLVMP